MFAELQAIFDSLINLVFIAIGYITSKIIEQFEKIGRRKSISSMMSLFLDDIGYSRERIRERKKIGEKSVEGDYPCHVKINNTAIRFDTILLAGSNGEGITFSLDSDYDLLYVDSRDFSDMVVPSHPGYVFMVERQPQNLETALLTFKNKFVNRQNGTGNQQSFNVGPVSYTPSERQGPSMPVIGRVPGFTGNLPVYKMDHVHGLQCHFPGILDDWCRRPRVYDWPSTETINDVCTLPSYVVNAGLKNSYLYDYQWRISFTPAEIFLASTFNDTQMKVYILLKTIAKNILSPVSDDITSYIIKNVMFWYFEGCPISSCTDKYMLDRLKEALELLKTSIERKNLPNYMIPARNLFLGKLQSQEKIECLVKTLVDLQSKLEEIFRQILESPADVKVPIFLETKDGLLKLSGMDLFFVIVYNQMFL